MAARSIVSTALAGGGNLDKDRFNIRARLTIESGRDAGKRSLLREKRHSGPTRADILGTSGTSSRATLTASSRRTRVRTTGVSAVQNAAGTAFGSCRYDFTHK